MTITELAASFIAVSAIAGVWLLFRALQLLGLIVERLCAIDAEVFRFAQVQDPAYGLCSSCGRRALVRHVVPKDAGANVADEPELFYCMPCYWMSNSVAASGEKRFYKDRMTDRDRMAARLGPG